MSSRTVLRSCIFGIVDNDAKERIEGPLYFATETMIKTANYEKSMKSIPDSEILRDTLYHLCYEISPEEDIITARINDEELESRLKEKWNDNINVLSGFLLACKVKTKIFFTSLIVNFKKMKKEEEERTQLEMMKFSNDEKFKVASVLKFVPTTNMDRYTVYVLKDRFTRACKNVDQFEIFPVKYPAHHPLFDSRHSIFKSLKETQDILIEHATDHMPRDRIEQIKIRQDVAGRTTKFPFIVIEGLDGVGKSTLVKNLTKQPDALEIQNPPNSISEYRPVMAEQCQPLCRAFYTLGNYLVAEEIKRTLDTSSVVLDRFWHSTAAYAIAFEAKCGGKNVIPAKGHPIYQWPNDLLKPLAVIFLELSEDERQQRMLERGGRETNEESQLKRYPLLRERLIGAYKNMENPSCIIIDASKSEEEVCENVISELTERNIL